MALGSRRGSGSMPDDRLRAIQRRAAQGDEEAEAALFLERVRMGIWPRSRLELLTMLRHPAAVRALPELEPEFKPLEDPQEWLHRNEVRASFRPNKEQLIQEFEIRVGDCYASETLTMERLRKLRQPERYILNKLTMKIRLEMYRAGSLPLPDWVRIAAPLGREYMVRAGMVLASYTADAMIQCDVRPGKRPAIWAVVEGHLALVHNYLTDPDEYRDALVKAQRALSAGRDGLTMVLRPTLSAALSTDPSRAVAELLNLSSLFRRVANTVFNKTGHQKDCSWNLSRHRGGTFFGGEPCDCLCSRPLEWLMVEVIRPELTDWAVSS